MKITSLTQLYDQLPDEQLVMTELLREIILETIPGVKEKISYNVPFFYKNKSICLVWPSAIPRGGFTSGVMLAFWYGNRLKDVNNYLNHGTNKQIYFKIFQKVEEIDVKLVKDILSEAVALDEDFKVIKRRKR